MLTLVHVNTFLQTVCAKTNTLPWTFERTSNMHCSKLETNDTQISLSSAAVTNIITAYSEVDDKVADLLLSSASVTKHTSFTCMQHGTCSDHLDNASMISITVMAQPLCMVILLCCHTATPTFTEPLAHPPPLHPFHPHVAS